VQHIIVDYNDHWWEDGEECVQVGFEDAWQLTGYDLRDGSPALFIQPCDLEMAGTLRRMTAQAKPYWYGVVDPSTLRHYVRADLRARSERVQVIETADLMRMFHDGQPIVLYDDDGEVYGTLEVIERQGERMWQGIPDWTTHRPLSHYISDGMG
jgi:hypothetical protein